MAPAQSSRNREERPHELERTTCDEHGFEIDTLGRRRRRSASGQSATSDECSGLYTG